MWHVQCQTFKLDKLRNGSHSGFWKFLTPPSCSEWQNTSKNALWCFSHDFLGVANFFGDFFGAKAVARLEQVGPGKIPVEVDSVRVGPPAAGG
jgi:hypothetical protein